MKSQASKLLGVTSGDAPLRQYSSEAAAELGDLCSRIADLDLAFGALEHLKAIRSLESDLVIETSLYCAAAIFYRRCFSSGVRKRLSLPVDEELSGEERADHNLLLAVANKHIAHSVNPFEEVKVGVALEFKEGEPVLVRGVAPCMSRLSSHNETQLARFSTLVLKVKQKLAAQIGEFGQRVAAEAAGTPAEELLALPVLEFGVIDDARANKSR